MIMKEGRTRFSGEQKLKLVTIVSKYFASLARLCGLARLFGRYVRRSVASLPFFPFFGITATVVGPFCSPYDVFVGSCGCPCGCSNGSSLRSLLERGGRNVRRSMASLPFFFFRNFRPPKSHPHPFQHLSFKN